MGQKCLSVNLPEVAKYIAAKTAKFNLTSQQVKTFTEMYLTDNDTDKLPTDKKFIAYIEANDLISIDSNSELINEIYEALGFSETVPTGWEKGKDIYSRAKPVKTEFKPGITELPNGNYLIRAYRTDDSGKGSKGFGQRGEGLYLALTNPYPGKDVNTVEFEINPSEIVTAKNEFKGTIPYDKLTNGKGNFQDRVKAIDGKAFIGGINSSEDPNLELVLYDQSLIEKANQSKKRVSNYTTKYQLYNLPTQAEKQKALQLYSEYVNKTGKKDIEGFKKFISENQPVTQPSTSVEGFQGYKGGFEDKGKGTPQGDGKDKAMRQVANSFIGEEDGLSISSSTRTSAEYINKNESTDNKDINTASLKQTKVLGIVNSLIIDNYTDVNNAVVMLARNGSLKNRKLEKSTKESILNAHNSGAEFIVGDMPNVDSQFIDYLDEIGAKYTIYHTGNTPRIKINQKLKLEVKPEESKVVSVEEHILTKNNQFENISLLDQQEQLDALESSFFLILKNRAKGAPITKEFFEDNLDSILNTGIPNMLKAWGLIELENNYHYLKSLLIGSRLKQLGVSEDIEEEAVNDRDSVVAKSSIMFDAVETAKDEVVYLFKSLFTKEPLIGNIPKQYNFSEAMRNTMNILGGSTTLDQQIKLIQDSNLPYKDQILNGLGFIDGQLQNQVLYEKVRTSFFEQFSKAKSEFHIVDLRKDGLSFNALDSTLKQSVKEAAKSKFRLSSYIKVNSNGKAVIKSPIELKPLNPLQFLNAIGFDVTSGDMSSEVKAAALAIKEALTSRNNISWVDDPELRKTHELSGYLNTILDTIVARTKNERNLQVRNAEGESQSSVHNHSYFSRKINKLKSGFIKAKTKLESDIAAGKFNYTIISGATVRAVQKSFNKLGRVDLYNTAITNMFTPGSFVFSLPRTSDKSLEQGIVLERDKNAKTSEGMVMTEQAYMSQYVYYGGNPSKFLEELYERYKTDLALNTPTKFTKNFTHPRIYWQELLKDEAEDVLTQEEFNEKYMQSVNTAAETVFNELKSYGVIRETTSRRGTSYIKTVIPVKIVNRFLTEEQKEKSKYNPFTKLTMEEQLVVMDKIAKAYTFNSMYYGYELSKMLYGNFTGTKSPEDFFKRTSAAIAETRSNDLSPAKVNQIKATRHSSMVNFPSPIKLRVKIYKETETTSNPELLELTTQITGLEGKKNPYSKNNVDDGQGKIHFGIYREINKMINRWTEAQEKVYNKLMNNQQLAKEDKKVTFPPLKPVGYDVIEDNGVELPIFLKLSVYPLIPAAVKGTNNEKVLALMNKEGIGLTGPDSIIKMSRPNTKPEFDSKGQAIADPNATFEVSMD
jgi:hypothetical protein